MCVCLFVYPVLQGNNRYLLTGLNFVSKVLKAFGIWKTKNYFSLYLLDGKVLF